jgi:hypothetical protein
MRIRVWKNPEKIQRFFVKFLILNIQGGPVTGPEIYGRERLSRAEGRPADGHMHSLLQTNQITSNSQGLRQPSKIKIIITYKLII